MKNTTEQLNKNSYLYGSNAPYIEQLFEQYCQSRNSVSKHWKDYFDRLYSNDVAIYHPPIYQNPSNQCSPRNLESKFSNPNAINQQYAEINEKKQSAVLRLINAYRVRGHQVANLDPINLY
jgi:2-oxoglutarate dehydrogenase E1 component